MGLFSKKKNSSGKKASSSAESCPTKGKLIVIANRINSEKSNFKSNVSVKLEELKLSGKTNSSGVWEKSKVKGGRYDLTASLKSKDQKKYKILTPLPKSVRILDGQSVTVDLNVTPLADVKVIVKVDGDDSKKLNTDVNLSGPANEGSQTKSAGFCEFNSIPVGNCSLTARLTKADEKDYYLETSTAQHQLKESEKGEVEFVVKQLEQLEVKVVDDAEPEANVAAQVSLVGNNDHPDNQAAKAPKVFKLKASPTQHRIKLELTDEQKEIYKIDADQIEAQVELQPNTENKHVFTLSRVLPVHLALQFQDPNEDNKPRNFPPAIPLLIRLSDSDSIEVETGANGQIFLKGTTDVPVIERKFKKFTLELTQTKEFFIECEKEGAAIADATLQEVDDISARYSPELATFTRAFKLPVTEWTTVNSEWELKEATCYADGEFIDLDKEGTTIGTKSKVAKLILNPHWQFNRFEFFDRTYGQSHHSDKPISLPAIMIEGFSNRPELAKVNEAKAKAAEVETALADREAKKLAWENAKDEEEASKELVRLINAVPHGGVDVAQHAADKADADARVAAATPAEAAAKAAYDAAIPIADTKVAELAALEQVVQDALADAKTQTASSWTLLPDDKAADRVICVPWIIRKEADADAPKPDDKSLILFKLKEGLYVHSKSDTELELVELAADAAELNPAATRLAYYDLPSLWKSQGFFARIHASGGEKHNRFEQMATEDTTAKEPLSFCLDDIVLAAADGKTLGDYQWNPSKRAAVFSHLFAGKLADGTDVADLNNVGIYKADTAAHMNWFTEVPTGTAAGEEGTANTESNRNYIADYAKWTRLVVANGNIFDCFDQRSQDSALGVVGARAAVNWQDATAPFPGVSIGNQPTFRGQNFTAPPNFSIPRPLPGRPVEPRPGVTSQNYCSIQPFFEQRYAKRYTERFDEANDDGIGRFDMVGLRCCGIEEREGAKFERAVNIQYIRHNFEFVSNPISGETINQEPQWKNAWITNVMNRWNGFDPVAYGNAHKSRLVAADAAKAVVSDVIWFLQDLPNEQAHYHVRVVNNGADSRDWRSGDGTGDSSPGGYKPASADGRWFPSAHETGHANSQPDEYNERWNGASYTEPSLKSNLPADPYMEDKLPAPGGAGEPPSPQMNGNSTMRNRYFWHCAEWMRENTGDIEYMVEHDTYKDFKLPAHPTPKRSYAYWPLRSDLDHVPAKPAIVTATRGKQDVFLYPMGKEQWTAKDIFGKQNPPAGPGADHYDGIVVITVNLNCTLPVWGAVNSEATKSGRRSLLQAMTRGANFFNYKYYISGKVNAPDGSTLWEFKRCLVHFSPRYVANDFPDAALVNSITGSLGPQFNIEVDAHATANFSRWVDPAGNVTDLPNSAAWTALKTAPLDTTATPDHDQKIADYHALNKADVEERMKLLKELIALPEVLAQISDVAAWNTQTSNSTVHGVHTALADYHAADLDDFGARVTLLDALHAKLSQAGKPAEIQATATSLATEAQNKRNELKIFQDLRDKADAKMKSLDRAAGNNSLLMRAVFNAAVNNRIHNFFKLQFPGMLGIYKSPAKVVKEDLLILLNSLNLVDLAIEDV